MILFVAILIVVSLLGIKIVPLGKELNCLSRSQAFSLNGISIVVVWLCHVWDILLVPIGYSEANLLDTCYLFWKGHVRQLLVVSFLFYSGYGVMEQIKLQGGKYLNDLPLKRIFTTWINFVVAVVVFGLMNIVIVDGFSVWNIIWGFTGLVSIGNPTWYILCILWGYTSIWATIKLLGSKINSRFAIVGTIIFFMASYMILTIFPLKRNFWWRDTALVIPFGVFVSLFKNEVTCFVRKHYCASLCGSVILFILCYQVPFRQYGIAHNVLSILFFSMILLITARISITNGILEWLGRHVFPIYMYHTLYFLILRHYIGDAGGSQFLAIFYVALCFGLTMLTAWLYPYWCISFKNIK